MRPARVAWFTGLSGAGKSTIAAEAVRLIENGRLQVKVLDGDAVRERLHRHLGFSPEDIRENNRLIAGLCRDALAEYDVVLVPIISPFRDSRRQAREALGHSFVEVYVKASLEEVSRRDPKGLYRDAREGRVQGLIGVAPGVPYEPPDDPDLVLDTERWDARSCAVRLVEYLLSVSPDSMSEESL